ncbi:MAG: hypothetical protein R2809_05160 [Flavobacteriales bacterium]
MEENNNIDKNSLKFLNGKTTDWNELTKDCVCFANAQVGEIFIGSEVKATLTPGNQKIEDWNLLDIIQKNITTRTVNIGVAFPSLRTQQTIVRQLDALRSETQKLEAVYQKKIVDLEELKKSILQKAFAGELMSRVENGLQLKI